MPLGSDACGRPSLKSLFRILPAASIALLGMASAALAQPRPLTPALSCAQARQIIATEGSAVLSTGPFTYDRYVLHGGFCSYMQTTRPALVPTLDTPKCFIGYLCVERNRLVSR